MHGPIKLVDAGFPDLAYVQDDPAKQSSLAALQKFRSMDATVLHTGAGGLPVRAWRILSYNLLQ